MNEPRQIAVVRSYDELINALRERAVELNATREAIDEVAGLQRGYAAKLLAPVDLKTHSRNVARPTRALGRLSMGPMLNALGVMLLVVEDAATMKRYGNRVSGGNRAYILNGGKNVPVILKFSLRRMKEIGRLGGQARLKKINKRKRVAIAKNAGRSSRKNMTAEQARALARKAIKARWHKPDITELPPAEAIAMLNAAKQGVNKKPAK